MAKPFKTRITEMLGIQFPILMGGMQWITRAEFVAHACNAGGLGFITAESFENPEDLRAEIRKMRTLTDKPFGINISMVPEIGDLRERTYQLCDVVCEEGVPVVETAGRSPAPLLPRFKEAGVKVIHKLTSVRHALSAQKAGVDAIALLGYGSGGHIGLEEVASFISLPQAAERLEIPVIAAGGVANGRGFLGALAMGAEGVLMGSRFLTTRECPIHDNIKAKYVDAQAEETVLLMRTIRNPMRSIHNKLADEVLAVEAQGATLEEILTKVAGRRTKDAYGGGDPEVSMLPCGQVVGLIEGVKTVREVIEDVIEEAVKLRQRLDAMAE
ncbi:MAG: nitronate monooxygenase family protein [Proteobacteria bacterium]|nr:nitronate monooxygenase family protein [Pseudomonadota bacterium]